MNGRELEATRQKLRSYYGNRCWVCTLSGNDYPLEVDHWDGNPDNNNWWNKHLLCKPMPEAGCHYIKHHPLVKGKEGLTFSLSLHHSSCATPSTPLSDLHCHLPLSHLLCLATPAASSPFRLLPLPEPRPLVSCGTCPHHSRRGSTCTTSSLSLARVTRSLGRLTSIRP